MKGWKFESKRHSLARQGIKTGKEIKHDVATSGIRTKDFRTEHNEKYFEEDKKFSENLKMLTTSIEELQKIMIEENYFDKDDVDGYIYLNVKEEPWRGGKSRRIEMRLQFEKAIIEVEVIQTPTRIGLERDSMLSDDWRGSFLMINDRGEIEEHGIYFANSKDKFINDLKRWINQYAKMNYVDKDFKLSEEE